MYLLCIVLIVAVSVLMCGIVLIQNSKGGGLASSFASSNQIMGVRKTTDFLEKLAIVIALLSVAAAWTLPTKTEAGHDSMLIENAVDESAVNPESFPEFDVETETAPETAAE